MSERREVMIEELDRGFVIRLDWRYVERSHGTLEPRDRKVIAHTAEEAFEIATDFMMKPMAAALSESK